MGAQLARGCIGSFLNNDEKVQSKGRIFRELLCLDEITQYSLSGRCGFKLDDYHELNRTCPCEAYSLACRDRTHLAVAFFEWLRYVCRGLGEANCRIGSRSQSASSGYRVVWGKPHNPAESWRSRCGADITRRRCSCYATSPLLRNSGPLNAAEIHNAPSPVSQYCRRLV